MTIDLKDKAICITGASSGIGRATAIACARAGMRVVVAARREDRLAEVVGRIRGEGGEAEAFALDVTDAARCAEMIVFCEERFGSVYSVFANAGYGVEEPMYKESGAAMRKMFEVNFFGTWNVIEPVLPKMLAAGRGHVVICSSCLARFPVPYFGTYCATKAAQHHIGRAMHVELKHKGVFTSTVHPVGTRTEFFDVAKEKSGSDGATLDGHAPTWLTQTPETVARAVVKCLRRPRPEVWPSWAWVVRVGMCLGGMTPRLADLGVRRLVREYEAAEGQGGQ
ncbi:MAG: SDR family NAD(P)-dependent oxidoreductase [Phycisphaeraceae bacterium]|nr:SDR family NAD(P)-dependent oxidoreductase [Phycisphaerales bacterium]MCB9843987.1 SDR family NAD(P)-dependent oxidoreductase [Phycisphaeraceae bacterium]